MKKLLLLLSILSGFKVTPDDNILTTVEFGLD